MEKYGLGVKPLLEFPHDWFQPAPPKESSVRGEVSEISIALINPDSGRYSRMIAGNHCP
jgi:hypothetical protein